MRNIVLRLLLLVVTGVSAATAANFSFTGTFTAGSDIQFFTFTTAGGTTTSLRTLSYGGGTNILGDSVAPGGFDPHLSLFILGGVSDGAGIGTFDDSAVSGGCAAGITAGTDGCLDSFFNNSLSAGTYTVALSQFDITANGDLGDGFTYSPVCTSEFCSGFDNVTSRTGAWELDIISATSASLVSAVPEPDTVALLAAPLALLLLTRRRAVRSN